MMIYYKVGLLIRPSLYLAAVFHRSSFCVFCTCLHRILLRSPIIVLCDVIELTPPPARYSHAHPISIDKHCGFAPVFTCKKHVLVCLSNPRVGQPSLTVS